jgi:hypothetical protein
MAMHLLPKNKLHFLAILSISQDSSSPLILVNRWLLQSL